MKDRDSTTPFISVVIPAYNEAEFIRRTLESLQRQDYTNFEVIVVDNNSTDGTATIAAEYGAIVVHEPHRGVSYARQAGCEVARGSIIATTDADTVLPHGWLSHIVARFDADPRLTAYGGLYTLYSGTWFSRFTVPYIIRTLFWMSHALRGVWGLTGANMAMRYGAFKEVGGFNTTFQLGEDLDLGERLNQVGTVVLDRRFVVSTSGRRYRLGILRAGYHYLPHFIARIVFKKHRFNQLSAERTESLATPLILILMIIPLITVSFFYRHTLVVRAGQLEDYGERTIQMKQQQVKHYIGKRIAQPLP